MVDEPQNSSDSLTQGTAPAKTTAEQAASLFGTTSAKAEPASNAAPGPTATGVPPTEEAPKAAETPPPATEESLTKAVTDAKTPEEKTAAEKALADFKAVQEAGAPLTMETLKIPEGIKVEDADAQAFLGILNNKELKPAEVAQQLIDLQAKVAREASEKGTQAWKDLQATWQAEAQADPKIGGDKLDPALGEIDRAIDTFTESPEEAAKLRNVFDLTGFGNKIEAIRFLHRLASAAQVTEGRPAAGAPHDPRAGKTQAQTMYPNLP